MHASDSKPQSARKKALGRVAKVLIFVLVFAAADLALTFALVPYGSNSEGMWGSYWAHADDDIDSVIVGTSHAELSINPYTLDDCLGSSTFNMATPSQLFSDSQLAVEQAFSDHDIKRVYVGFGYSSFKEGTSVSASVAFAEAKMEFEPFPNNVRDFFAALTYPAFVGTPESLGMLFPWTTNHIDYNVAELKSNIYNRLHLTPLEAAGATPGSTVYEKGFLPGYGTFDQSAYAQSVDLYEPTGEPFSQDLVNPLVSLVSTCVEHGAEVYVVAPPVPLYNVLRYGSDYPLRMAAIRDAVEAAGGTYIDANMLRPEVYRPTNDDYLDGLHINEPASEKFGKVLADLVTRSEQGEDIAAYSFSYEDWDSYLASLDTIALANFTSESSKGNLTINAYCYAGSDVTPEYEFLLANDDGTYQELRGYGTDSSYTLPVEGHGYLTLRVNARQLGATDPERYIEKTVAY